MIAEQVLMISSILLALSILGPKCKSARRAGEKREAGKSRAEGKAIIRYEYSDKRAGTSVTAEVPVRIKQDEVFLNKWHVRGSKRTAWTSQDQRADLDGTPLPIHRDVEVRIYFDGELTTAYEEGEPNCHFQLKNFFVTDLVENQRYGNPPMTYKELFKPGSAYQVLGALPEKEWIFDKYNRAVHVPRPESQTLKALITDVQWPEKMREAFRWE